jgi:SecD/SecF fusion protein
LAEPSETDPNASLAAIFSTPEMRDRINFNATNAEVLGVLGNEVDACYRPFFPDFAHQD